MGCFLGCFGGVKDKKRSRRRVNRHTSQLQKNQVYDVQKGDVVSADQNQVYDVQKGDVVSADQNQINAETTSINLDSELRPEGVAQLSPSPRKRVTFTSNIIEHVSVHESIDSQPECGINNIEREKQEDLEKSSQSHSVSEDNKSALSSDGSYPPNHRYHNARDSDDEAEEYYGDSDLDDEDDYEDSDDEDIYVRTGGHQVSSESFSTESLESRTEEVVNKEAKAFGSRDRSGYISSVLKPVENIAQWKAAKLKGPIELKQQKENSTANIEPALVSFSPEPFSSKTRNTDQEIAVNASLSNWLVSREETPPPSKKTSFNGFQTMSEVGSTPVRSFEDRPILGALTVDELKQLSQSASPRKSPSRSPEDMPIIGSVGTYWSNSSFKGGIRRAR